MVGACLESKRFSPARMNSFPSPGGVGPSGDIWWTQFCSDCLSRFWDPASFTSSSSGRSVPLCCPYFLHWWGPWWDVFWRLCLSTILDGILWFKWSIQPQDPRFGKPRERWSWELFYQYPEAFSPWSERLAQVLNVHQHFISGWGFEGHILILFSWSLTSDVPRIQLALGSCIMEFVHLQDKHCLEYSCQLFGVTSHPPERVTWIWIRSHYTRIESLFVFNKCNTLNIFKLDLEKSFKDEFPVLEKDSFFQRFWKSLLILVWALSVTSYIFIHLG